MRELTINECEAVAGGHGSGCMWGTSCTITDLTGITVIGQPGGGGGYGPPPIDPGYGGGYSGGGGVSNPPQEPDCHDVNEVAIANDVATPDGAKYYLPEGVTQDYLDAALAHLRTFDPVTQMAGLVNEFRLMYRDPSHDNFLDFKRWDTANPGQANPTVSYWSDAEGAYVSASAFEAFGNFIYGAFGVAAGIPAEVLRAAAGWTQSGNDTLLEQLGGAIFMEDDAMDKPHVDLGITKGQHYKWSGLPIASVVPGSCN